MRSGRKEVCIGDLCELLARIQYGELSSHSSGCLMRDIHTCKLKATGTERVEVREIIFRHRPPEIRQHPPEKHLLTRVPEGDKSSLLDREEVFVVVPADPDVVLPAHDLHIRLRVDRLRPLSEHLLPPGDLMPARCPESILRKLEGHGHDVLSVLLRCHRQLHRLHLTRFDRHAPCVLLTEFTLALKGHTADIGVRVREEVAVCDLHFIFRK